MGRRVRGGGEGGFVDSSIWNESFESWWNLGIQRLGRLGSRGPEICIFRELYGFIDREIRLNSVGSGGLEIYELRALEILEIPEDSIRRKI